MRAVRVVVAVALLIGIGLAVWLAIPNEPTQTVVLPDGSKLTLLKVTRGPKHFCRYDNRWQDLLAPVLPQKLRSRFSPRILTYTSSDTNALMVWFRHEDKSKYAASVGSLPYFVAVAGSNGLESSFHDTHKVTATLAKKNPSTTSIDGWELSEYPHRARQFTVKVSMRYDHSGGAEFKVAGRVPKKSPAWSAAKLPTSRATNNMEVTLLQLETGLSPQTAGFGSAPETGDFSRAIFSMKENGVPTDDWRVHQLELSTASGELRPTVPVDARWWRFVHHVYFPGPLWLDEPAWKLTASFARSTNFPPAEIWTIKGVEAPEPGKLIERQETTNINNIQVGLAGVSGAGAKLPDGYTAIRPHPNVHFRTPYPGDDVRIRLIGIADNQGRVAKLHGISSGSYLGGRTTMPKEMIYGFGFEIPEGAKSLDVTFAVTKVVTVEFVAKPVLVSGQ